MRIQDPPTNVLDVISRKLVGAETTAKKLANTKDPTVPVYDLPNNPPATAFDGEIALDQSGKVWWYIDNEWRTC
jgi:hypothetical protein